MSQPPGYPKIAVAMLQCYIVVEDGREVVVHDHDVLLAITSNEALVEILLAKMRESGGSNTIVRSSIQPPPSAILEMMAPEPERNDSLNSLLEIADASVQNQD